MDVITMVFVKQRLKRRWQEAMRYCKPRFVCLCSIFIVFEDCRATYPIVCFHQRTMNDYSIEAVTTAHFFFFFLRTGCGFVSHLTVFTDPGQIFLCLLLCTYSFV